MRALFGTALALSAALVCAAQAPEVKRADAGQEYGVINYHVDRSTPQVIAVELEDKQRAIIGTYTLDDRTPNQRSEKLFFGRRQGFYTVTHHSSGEGTQMWVHLRDQVEEAKATFNLD